MSDKSAIEWLNGGSTWNPVRGCTPIAPECKNCYARTFAERWRGIAGHPYGQGFDPRTVPEALELPLRWKKPRTIFVASMSDPFHDAFGDDLLDAVFGVIALAHWHRFILLTKRADRMHRYFTEDPLVRWAVIEGNAQRIHHQRTGNDPSLWLAVHDLPNLTLGVSVGTRARLADLDLLRQTPAARYMVSFEPLLEDLGNVDLRGIDLAAIGGESGPGARPCNVAWIRSLVRQCRAAGCAPYVKQLGAHVEDRNDAGLDGAEPDEWPEGTDVEHDEADTGYQGAPVRIRLRDRKGSDMAEWPADLRIRELPEAR